MLRLAFYLAFGSSVAVLFSIAVCQILLALSIVALLLSGAKLRLPPIWKPLGCFLLITLISLAFSPDPASGLPQVRKIFVYSVLLTTFSLFRDLDAVRRLYLCWVGAGGLVALRALIQFGNKFMEARELGRNFYEYYVAERITGFMSHWMTFGGQEMFVLLLLIAFLYFAPQAWKRGVWLWLFSLLVVSTALLLGFTRSIWIATAAGLLYLTWFRKRWLVLAAPVALLAGAWIAPGSVRTRFASMFQPKREVDSNQHRIITWRTGLRMIEAHPWLGLGPEQVKVQFLDYVPADVPRPLPSGWYGHLHNIYLHYAAERGVFALLALLWMLFQMLWDLTKSLRRLAPGPSDARFVLHGSIAVILATMIAGIFELNLGDSEVLTMFLVVSACGYIAVEQGAAGV